jgi:sugar phosphate isomerase/epimerase
LTVYSSVSAHLFAYEPLVFEHLKAISETGYRHIELWAMRPHLDFEDQEVIGRLKGWLRDLSLQTASFHAPFYAHFDEARAGNWLSLSTPVENLRRESLTLTETAMRVMADIGARIAILHPGGPSPAGEVDSFDGLRVSLETLLPLAEQLDLVLAIENIPAPMGHAGPLSEFIAKFGHARVKICLDTGHANITDGEYLETAFRSLAPHTAATHIHDNDGKKDAHLIPGKGTIPWPSLWKALGDADYSGPLTYELQRGDGTSYAETLSELSRSAPPHTLENFPVNGHAGESAR